MDEVTGNPQPSYRLEGLKITAEFPKLKGDEEQEQDNVERKQVGLCVSVCVCVLSGDPCAPSACTASSWGNADPEACGGGRGRLVHAWWSCDVTSLCARRLLSACGAAAVCIRFIFAHPLHLAHVLHPQELSASRALEILKRIPTEDAKALGFDCVFTRPDWMIIQNLPVPPPPVRPSVMMDSSSRWGRVGRLEAAAGRALGEHLKHEEAA